METSTIRTSLIDGLPNSYDTNYVLNTKKICELCLKYIKKKQIEKNEIICTEEFEFFHKSCLTAKDINYFHTNPNDKSSIIKLIQSDEIKK